MVTSKTVSKTVPLPPAIQAPLDARKERLCAIFNRRSCTALEMLTADFGHWPPKGLTVTAPPEGPIEIVSAIGGFRKRFEEYNKKKLERLHKLTEEKRFSAWQTTLATQIVTAMNLTYCFKFVMSQLAQRNTIAFVDNMRTDAININSLSLRFTSTTRLQDFLSHEAIHILQRRTKDARLKNTNEELKEIYTGMSEDVFRDLGSQDEIQARLHPLLAKMYQQTQALPYDKSSLWIMLLGCGLLPNSDSVSNEVLEAVTACGMSKDDLLATAAQSSFSNQFNETLDIWLLQNFMDEAGERKFWFDILPRIYADLLVLYGDTETGKKITGPGPSP